MCSQIGYNPQHQYWSGWFRVGSSQQLIIKHNLAAHPKNQGSFFFSVVQAPLNKNPVGVWAYTPNGWVDLRTAPAAAADSVVRDFGSSAQPYGFNDYLQSTGRDPGVQGQNQGSASPLQGGKSREQCINEICPRCSRSMALLDRYADPECQACINANKARIDDCMRGEQYSGSTQQYPGGNGIRVLSATYGSNCGAPAGK